MGIGWDKNKGLNRERDIWLAGIERDDRRRLREMAGWDRQRLRQMTDLDKDKLLIAIETGG